MTTLDDDIARVAALRGRNVDEVLELSKRARCPSRAEVEAVLQPNPKDLPYYDRLPPKSRAFIRAQDRSPLNAAAWYWLLHEYGDEDEIIKAVQYCL